MVARKSRANRKNVSRKNRSRKNRSRRNRRNMMGGNAPVGDMSMNMPMKDSLAQGNQYLNIHKGQYGGGMGSYPGAVVQGSLMKGGAVGPYPTSVMASTLPVSMVPAARTGPLDAAIAGIQGMQDGGRRSKHKKHRSMKHRGKKNRSNKRNKRSYSHRGGSHRGFSPSPVDANSMLLPAGMEKQASLNYEWSMAKNPSAFLPKA
jgi:hypothetical protein